MRISTNMLMFLLLLIVCIAFIYLYKQNEGYSSNKQYEGFMGVNDSHYPKGGKRHLEGFQSSYSPITITLIVVVCIIVLVSIGFIGDNIYQKVKQRGSTNSVGNSGNIGRANGNIGRANGNIGRANGNIGRANGNSGRANGNGRNM